MTEPTDAELDTLIDEVAGLDSSDEAFRAFARAVLARWGQPSGAGEPVARIEVGRTKGGISLTNIAEPAAFQLPEGMYALYTTPQPVEREPLSEEQIEGLCCEANRGFDIEYEHYEKAFRDAERAHGIAKKGGGEC